jgi:glycosyltransferase involved in cell wall biosynthesis
MKFRLKFEHVLCVSQAVKIDLGCKAGLPSKNLRVVHNGVETDRFVPKPRPENARKGLTLLYAGSLVPHKGVHTAVEAISILKRRMKLENVRLTILGSGHPDYEIELRNAVTREGIGKQVVFRDRVPRERMPDVLPDFDVLLFPSIWEEPLSRMMQEGMAAGLVVVGTLTGGTGELLVEGETGLTFPPGDAETLAQRLMELHQAPEQVKRLARNGRATVVARFEMGRMIDEIEDYLAQVVSSTQIYPI